MASTSASRSVEIAAKAAPADTPQFVLPRRNYAAVEFLESGDLLFDIRVEKHKGSGDTVSYPVKAPPPRWEARAYTAPSVAPSVGAPSVQNGGAN